MTTFKVQSNGGIIARIVTAPKRVFRVSGSPRGPAGPIGPTGKNIELRNDGTFIQWREVGGATWNNLVPVSALVGATGPAGANGTNGTNGTNGAAGSNGTNGKSVEIQNNGTFIQWRLVGDSTWINIVALATLKGADGTNGTNGSNGTNGTNGYAILNGIGAPGAGVGVNGDFYINTSNYSIYGPKASGAWGAPTSLVGPSGAGTGDMVLASAQLNTGIKTFQTGTLLMRDPGNTFSAEPYSDANPPMTLNMTDQSTLPATPVAGQSTLYTPDGKSIKLLDNDGTGIDVADLTSTQTLANKTLTTPTIASFTNAQHNHTTAATGGQITDAALSAAVTVAKGGSGRTTATTAYGLIAAGTTATGAQQTISPGTSGQFLKSAGTAALAAFASITEADVTNLVTDLAAKAPLASPTFTGTPTLPTGTIAVTQTAGNNTTAPATTAFVTAAITANDVNDVHLAGAETISGVKTFSASPIVPTPTTGTQAANKAYVDSGLGSNSFVTSEAVTGAQNGVNSAYTTVAPYVGGTLELILNGQIQARGVDYTETTPGSGIFTFIGYAPPSTDYIRVNYQKVVATAGNADTVDAFHASSTPTANTILPLDASAKIPQSVLPAVPAWNSVTYAAGWSDFDTGVGTAPQYGGGKYMRDIAGVVHLKGLVKNTSGSSKPAPSVMFTLPAGYRPIHALRIGVLISDNGGEIDIAANGDVTVIGVSTVTNGGWLTLNNISFVAEQ